MHSMMDIILFLCVSMVNIIFFFNDTATTEIYTLSLHDALPISHLMDPATQPDPWNLAANSPPHSADHRLGDGTLRPERADAAYANLIEVNPDLTGNGGYDYVWSFHQENQNRSRGLWHQSASGQVRS